MKCPKCGYIIPPWHKQKTDKARINKMQKLGYSYRQIAAAEGISIGSVQIALGKVNRKNEIPHR